MNLTARIEKTRLALMAMIAPWFAFVLFYWARGAKPLPPRLAAFALETVARIEKAAAFLLMASVHAAPSAHRKTPEIESKAFCLAHFRVHNQQTRVTMASLHARLTAIWRFLNNLRRIARHLARRLQVQQSLRALGLVPGPSMRDTVAGARPAAGLHFHREKTAPP